MHLVHTKYKLVQKFIILMDGPRLKKFLTEDKQLTKAEMLDALKVSQGKLYGLFKQAVIDNTDRAALQSAFGLPKNFFSGPTQIGGNKSTQSMNVGLMECEKELAVARERIAQLEIRLQEKDRMIEILSKSNK